MAELQQGGVRRFQDAGVTNANATAFAGTGVNTPILPNSWRQQGNNSGNSNGQQDHNALANALKNLTDTGIVRTVDRLTGRRSLPPVVAGRDNVLHNVGIRGINTFAMGSLTPTNYQRQFDKSHMGKPLRVTGGEPSAWRNQINAEMTLARMNRPMNRDLVENGHYDALT